MKAWNRVLLKYFLHIDDLSNLGSWSLNNQNLGLPVENGHMYIITEEKGLNLLMFYNYV